MQQSKEAFRQRCSGFVWVLMVSLCFSTIAGAGVDPDRSISARFHQPGVVKLAGYEASHTIKIPVAKRWDIQKAVLNLSYVNSTALLQKRSRLTISLNQILVHQVDLVPEAPDGNIVIGLPVALLTEGYNDLTITATQSFTADGCAPGHAPEVWTSLNLYDSTLDITYDHRAVPLSLAAISDFLFDPKINDESRLHIVVSDYSPENIRLASLAAAGAALRFIYRPLHITLGGELQKNCDTIVIGSPDFINTLLEPYGEDEIVGTIGIRHLPRRPAVSPTAKTTALTPDKRYGLIYLSGDDNTEIDRTVKGFSLLASPLPALQTGRIGQVVVPEISRYSGEGVLAPDTKYAFKDIGFPTTTFTGRRNQGVELQWILPSDLLLDSNEIFTMSLNLAYAAGMREDSVLGIWVNDHFISSILLNDVKGGQFRGYQLHLPLSYLLAGVNTVSFKPVLTPLRTGNCAQVQTEHLALTVFGDSTVTLPKISHWAAMPRLRSLFEDGFPLTVAPDFKDTIVVLGDDSRATATAAVNVVAMLSQKRKIPPLGLRIQTKVAKEDAEILLIGRLDSLPTDITNASPLFPLIKQPFMGRVTRSIRQVTGWDRLRQRFYPSEEPHTSNSAALGMQMAAGKDTFLLHEFESPFSAMRSVVMLSADRSEDVERGAYALWKPAVQAGCRWGAAIVDLGGEVPKARSYKTSEAYFAGQLGPIGVFSLLSNAVISNLGLFLFALVAALLVLAGLLTLILRRRLRKKQEIGG